jgi:DNA mismatch endonuclease (patch repair protein)
MPLLASSDVEPGLQMVALGGGLRVPYPFPTSATASRIGRGNRKSGTKPERAVRSALHRAGLRYRVGYPIKVSIGKVHADAVFTRWRIALFVDGCFWHGCPTHGSNPKSNSSYWQPKLRRNRDRDAATDHALRVDGWEVVRVWEHDPPTFAVERLQLAIRSRQKYPSDDLRGGSVERAASANDIRRAFYEVVATRPDNEIAYRDLLSELLARGIQVRGATLKRQQDAVYGALKGDPTIRKVRPGVFAPAGTSSQGTSADAELN